MRAQSTLIGFPTETLDRARRRFDVRLDETPGFAPLRDAVMVPDCDPLYDMDGRRIDVTRRVNIPSDLAPQHVLERDRTASEKNEPLEVTIPEQLDVVEQPVVFVGAVWPHYGHFITDGMSKLWGMDRISELPLLMQARPSVRDHGCSYIHETFGRLRVVDRGLIVPTRPTLFRKVLAAKAAFQHTFRLYDCHQKPHLKVAESILAEDVGVPGGPEKVYLTRSKLKSRDRKAAEELELETRLRKEGFEIVAPEQQSFKDQVRLFNTAKWVVGTIGSAFHTCLFARPHPDRALFMMTWDKINPRYLMIDEMTGQRSYYLNCITVNSVDARERVTETEINVERAMAAMDEAGAFR
jgi:capsular polysaccharide biosynthesis protein